MTIRQVAGISAIKESGSNTFKMLKASTCEPQTLYLAKPSFKFKGKTDTCLDI